MEVNGDVYVVDFGRNWQERYFEAGLGSAGKPNSGGGLERMRAGFITHLHSDHIIDFPRLIGFGSSDGLLNRKQPLTIFGPPAPDFGPLIRERANGDQIVDRDRPTKSAKEMFDLLVSAFSTDINDNILDSGRPNIHSYLDVVDIRFPSGVSPSVSDVAPDMEPFEIYRDENVRVSAILVSHGPMYPVLALRFDTDRASVTLSADTCPCENLIRLAKGTDVLVHEANDHDAVRGRLDLSVPAQAAKYRHLVESHTDLRELAGVATRAGAKTLVLSHVAPALTEARVAETVVGFEGTVILARPAMEIVLD